MAEEFNLSEKIRPIENIDFGYGLNVEDVKEFIRLLKEEIDKTSNVKIKVGKNIYRPLSDYWAFPSLKKEIDKLAGDKLL